MAGSNRSGDLHDAQRSIPLGTVCAVLLTSSLYLLCVLSYGGVAERGTLTGAALFTAEVALPPPVVQAGITLSTLGAGLQSNPKPNPHPNPNPNPNPKPNRKPKPNPNPNQALGCSPSPARHGCYRPSPTTTSSQHCTGSAARASRAARCCAPFASASVASWWASPPNPNPNPIPGDGHHGRIQPLGGPARRAALHTARHGVCLG